MGGKGWMRGLYNEIWKCLNLNWDGIVSPDETVIRPHRLDDSLTGIWHSQGKKVTVQRKTLLTSCDGIYTILKKNLPPRNFEGGLLLNE